MKLVIKGMVLSAIVALTSTAARANLLVNGSLESNIAPKTATSLINITPGLHSKAITGWTIDSGKVDVVPDAYFDASAGNYSVDLVGTPGLGSISQKVTTTGGISYTLTFDFAVNPEMGKHIDERLDTKVLEVDVIGANGKSLVTSQTFTRVTGASTDQNMGYVQESITFIADGSSSRIRFKALKPLNLPHGLNANNIYAGPVIDNVDLELSAGAPAPEPASLAVMALGATALLARRRKA